MQPQAPVVDSIVEVRFKSNKPIQVIIGLLYQKFDNELANVVDLPILQLPIEIRQSDPNLINQPLYRMSGDNFVLSIGEGIISVGAVIDRQSKFYPGWSKFGVFAKNIIDFLFENQITPSVSRAGVRYINYFDTEGLMDKVKVDVKVAGVLMTENLNLSYENQFEEIKVRVQLAGKANVKNEFIGSLDGSIVDIDASEEKELADSESIKNMLDALHGKVEDTFFKIVKPEALPEGVAKES